MANRCQLNHMSKNYEETLQELLKRYTRQIIHHNGLSSSTANTEDDKDAELKIEFVQKFEDVVSGKLPQFKMISQSQFPEMSMDDYKKHRSAEIDQDLENEKAVLNKFKAQIDREEKKNALHSRRSRSKRA